MKRCVACLLTALALTAASRLVLAHHSFAAEYDSSKPITLTGKVTKLEWTNPHVYFYIDVADPTGKPTNWAIEGGSPSALYRAGWRRDSMKYGDVVTVYGHLARDGSHLANMRTATLADGRNVFGGQADGPPVPTRPPGR
jgi:hypothetical protein